MEYETIDLYSNNNSERWLVVHSDGRLILHTKYERHHTTETISLANVYLRNQAVAQEVAMALLRLKASDEGKRVGEKAP